MSFDTDRFRAIFYLVVVPLAIVGILILGFVNYHSEHTHASKQAQINKAQIKILRNALGEACHATTVLYGITSALILYYQAEPKPNSYRVRKLVDVLAGYGIDLGSLTACKNIARP